MPRLPPDKNIPAWCYRRFFIRDWLGPGRAHLLAGGGVFSPPHPVCRERSPALPDTRIPHTISSVLSLSRAHPAVKSFERLSSKFLVQAPLCLHLSAVMKVKSSRDILKLDILGSVALTVRVVSVNSSPIVPVQHLSKSFQINCVK